MFEQAVHVHLHSTRTKVTFRTLTMYYSTNFYPVSYISFRVYVTSSEQFLAEFIAPFMTLRVAERRVE